METNRSEIIFHFFIFLYQLLCKYPSSNLDFTIHFSFSLMFFYYFILDLLFLMQSEHYYQRSLLSTLYIFTFHLINPFYSIYVLNFEIVHLVFILVFAKRAFILLKVNLVDVNFFFIFSFHH